MTPLLILPSRGETTNVVAGSGLSLRSAGGKVMIGSLQKRVGFSGAWAVSGKVSASGIEVKVNRGWVNGMEPVIGKIPIGGVMPDGTPCDLGQPVITGRVTGRTYVCLKITPDKDGKIEYDEEEKKLGKSQSLTVELVEGFVGTADGASWYQPLAIFDQGGLVAQIAYFDYFYQAYKIKGKGWGHRMTVA